MIRNRFVRDGIRRIIRRTGFDIVRWPGSAGIDSAEREIVARVQSFTLTSPQRIVALTDAVEYVVKRKIDGAIVECVGVEGR